MRKLFFIIIAVSFAVILAAGSFIFYFYPRVIKPNQDYQEAVALFNNGDYILSALRFETINTEGQYDQQTKRAWLAAGDQSYADGDYAQARTYYLKGSADVSAFDKLDSAYYEKGVQAYADNERVEAENCFSCISYGSRYNQLLDPVRLGCAERFLSEHDIESAVKIFHVCGDASYPEIVEILIAQASASLDEKDLEFASMCFSKAAAYSDDRDTLFNRIDVLFNAAGEKAFNSGDTAFAERCFKHMRGTAALEEQMTIYNTAVTAYNEKRYFDAMAGFSSVITYSDSAAYMQRLKEMYKDYYSAKGESFYAVLSPEGRVSLHGEWSGYTSPDWSDITYISVGSGKFLLGIRNDGTVVFRGNSTHGNNNVSDWREIVSVACGGAHCVGLKANGSVVACGYDDNGQVSGVNSWTGITRIAVGDNFTVGVNVNGKVYACGSNSYGQTNVSEFTNITAVACGARHTVCLKSDGTVVGCGDNSFGQLNFSGWTDIIAIYAGGYHTVGVRSDGTILACGSNDNGECNVGDYRNPVSIACGIRFTLMLLADGSEIKLGAIND